MSMPRIITPRIIIHAGAGDIRRERLEPARELEMRTGLKAAIAGALQCLIEGGSALYAVELAVSAMEDSPLFNAGRGSVISALGQFEMDASIMDGRGSRAGALAAVKRIKNPIQAARQVMNHSSAVLLHGTAAEDFARQQGCEIVDGSYFYTQRRWQDWLKHNPGDAPTLDHSAPESDSSGGHGTVGAVALDSSGNLAAATSTGGMTNKTAGRIGDSALIGSGTYAQNGVCAVSTTGTGEAFIRCNTAFDVAARMRYANQSIEQAASEALEAVAAVKGEGGLIALAADGTPFMLCNSPGMYRASSDAEGKVRTAIFADEELR